LLFSEAVKKDANVACQENQIEMTVTDFVGNTLYCGTLTCYIISEKIYFSLKRLRYVFFDFTCPPVLARTPKRQTTLTM